MQFIDIYRRAGLDIQLADKAVEAGIQDVFDLLTLGRLKVFASCTAWFDEFRLYRRDGGVSRLLAEVAADVTFHLDRSASPGTRHTYTVTAVDGADPPNESDASPPVTETAPETPDAAAEGGEGTRR